MIRIIGINSTKVFTSTQKENIKYSVSAGGVELGSPDLETGALSIAPPTNRCGESQIVIISTAQLHTEKWLADVNGQK